MVDLCGSSLTKISLECAESAAAISIFSAFSLSTSSISFAIPSQVSRTTTEGPGLPFLAIAWSMFSINIEGDPSLMSLKSPGSPPPWFPKRVQEIARATFS